MKTNRAVFLDRDGTILTERNYLADPRKMKFYPHVFKALASLKRHGFKLIIISNQSGLARGYFSLKTLRLIHEKLKMKLAANKAAIDGIFFCPHLPDAGCPCRKPKTALIKKATQRFGIDMKKSFVIGDQVRDVELAARVGAKGILVLTGGGRSSRKKGIQYASKITNNLLTASHWVLKQQD